MCGAFKRHGTKGEIMSSLDDYPNLIDNTDQAKGRCNHFVQVLWTGDYVDYVQCNACEEKQALWREGNRL